MEKDIAQVLISEEVLQRRIRQLADQLSADYAGKDPVFVGVLKGVVLFSFLFPEDVQIVRQEAREEVRYYYYPYKPPIISSTAYTFFVYAEKL